MKTETGNDTTAHARDDVESGPYKGSKSCDLLIPKVDTERATRAAEQKIKRLLRDGMKR